MVGDRDIEVMYRSGDVVLGRRGNLFCVARPAKDGELEVVEFEDLLQAFRVYQRNAHPESLCVNPPLVDPDPIPVQVTERPWLAMAVQPWGVRKYVQPGDSKVVEHWIMPVKDRGVFVYTVTHHLGAEPYDHAEWVIHDAESEPAIKRLLRELRRDLLEGAKCVPVDISDQFPVWSRLKGKGR